LHVHTPSTKLNDQYSITDDTDVWDKYCEFLENSDVEVFGITDYFSIANYSMFIEKFYTKYPNSRKVFFPNIELRLEVGVNSDNEEVNIHVLFSNSIQTSKIEDFLRKLETNRTKSGANIFCSELSTKGDYEKACIDYKSLKSTLKKVFGNTKCYLIIASANNQGLRADSNSPRKLSISDEIDKICDCFFGNSTNIDYFLDKQRYETDSNGKKDLAKLCPVVTGSDSHSFEDLQYKLGKFYTKTDSQNNICGSSETTWLKANPTFNGLKQIMYEPTDRVKIQELKPDEKEDYQLIDKVSFIDDNFSNQPILLNKNLTAIIGGKSTGKSILLRNIAKTIDPDEVSKRLSEVDMQDYDRQINDFNVVWNDSQSFSKGEASQTHKKIIYIPQSYLNRLIDKKEDQSAIDEIIKNVLQQQTEISKAFEDLKTNTRDAEKLITSKIEQLFFVIKDLLTISEKTKEIGDKKGILSEIAKLKDEIAELKKISNLSKKDLENYDIYSSSLKALNTKASQIELDITRLIKAKEIIPFVLPNLDDLSSEIANTLKVIFDNLKIEFGHKYNDALEVELQKVKTTQKETKKQIHDLSDKILPLQKKVSESKSLDEKIKKLIEEEEKLKLIAEQETALEKKRKEYEDILDELINTHQCYYSEIFNAKNLILKQETINGELEFDINITFKGDSFQHFFIDEVCNLRTIGQFNDINLASYQYKDSVSFKDEVKKVITGILRKQIQLKSNYTQADAVRKLLQNWYIFDFKIKQNGDYLSSMSPGKKSFVLLKLLIELDNSRCPILLDQPEDDLDNRSIYFDLVRFIKSKKKERQIIIATHNPNLVVGADAECIIVANQEGIETKNKTYKFEYVQGGLEFSHNDKTTQPILYSRGIQEHVCDILEGGREAFENRKNKYNI